MGVPATLGLKQGMTRTTEALEAMPATSQRATGATRAFEAVNNLDPWTDADPFSSETTGGATAIRWAAGHDTKRGLLTRLRALRNETIGLTGQSAPITGEAPRAVQTQAAFDAQQSRQHNVAEGFREGLLEGFDSTKKIMLVVGVIAAVVLVVVLVSKAKG